jgi:hypothetical protein
MMSSSHTLPKYRSNVSTNMWMISSVMSSLKFISMQATKYRLAYLANTNIVSYRFRWKRVPEAPAAWTARHIPPPPFLVSGPGACCAQTYRLYTSFMPFHSSTLHIAVRRLKIKLFISRSIRVFCLDENGLYLRSGAKLRAQHSSPPHPTGPARPPPCTPANLRFNSSGRAAR